MGKLQKIVSFDFDDTLCLHDGSPNHPMLDLVRKYASEGCKCYVVTARNKSHETPGWIQGNQPGRVRVKKFIKEHQLPIKQCHFTNHELKGPTLWRIGASLHYDDKACHLRSALEHGIEGREPVILGPVPEGSEMYCRQPSHCEPFDEGKFRETLRGYNETPPDMLD